MKKWTWLTIIGAAALLAVALFATTAFARGPVGGAAAPQATANADNGDTSGWDCPMHNGLGAGGNGIMGVGYGMGLANQVTITRIAGVLGISADDLQTQLQNGQTIAQVAEAQSVDLGTVVDTVLAPEREMLNVRVKYGYLTQEQADSILQTATLQVQTMLTAVHMGLTGQGPSANPGNPGNSNGSGNGYGGMMGGGYGRGMMGWR